MNNDLDTESSIIKIIQIKEDESKEEERMFYFENCTYFACTIDLTNI